MKSNTSPNWTAFWIQALIGLLLSSYETKAQETVFNTAQFGSDGSSLHVMINGFPLYQLPDEGTAGAQSCNLSQYTKRGLNEIVLISSPLTKSDGSKTTKYGCTVELFTGTSIATAEAQLVRVERITDTDDADLKHKVSIDQNGNKSLRFQFNDQPDGGNLIIHHPSREIHHLPATGAESSLKLMVELPQSPLTDLPWLSPAVIPNAEDIEAIKQIVIAYHQALLNEDWPAVNALLDSKYTRIATGTGVAKQEAISTNINTLQTIFASDGFALNPLTVAELTVSHIQPLNLVKVDKAGAAPIRGSGNQLELTTEVYLSKIGTDWRIVE